MAPWPLPFAFPADLNVPFSDLYWILPLSVLAHVAWCHSEPLLSPVLVLFTFPQLVFIDGVHASVLLKAWWPSVVLVPAVRTSHTYRSVL